MTNTMRRFCLVAVLFFGGLVPLAAASGTGDAPSTPARSTGAYDGAVLWQDAQMTQDMSAPTADAGALVHRDDGQLARSRDPAFLRDFEAYTAQIDRMLARAPR